MALTVEDGSIVAGADSYIALADAITYASKRGIAPTLVAAEADDATWEQYLRRAFDYINKFPFVGSKCPRPDDPEPVEWPRFGVWIRNQLINSDIVPLIVRYAQVEIAISLSEDRQPDADYKEKKLVGKTVGPITKTYSPNEWNNADNWVLKKARDLLFDVLDTSTQVER